MSDETKPTGAAGDAKPGKKDESNLERYAFMVFQSKLQGGPRRDTETLAIDSYREAAIFLDVSARLKTGKLDLQPPTEELILSDVSAPKLKPTHPHNLASRRFGNLQKLLEINDLLAQNPLMETYGDLDWDAEQVRIARMIFPAYAEKAARAGVKKPQPASAS